jgi:hypothetical protein
MLLGVIIVFLNRGFGLMLAAGGERDVGGARILPEGSISAGGELCARNGLMRKGLGRIYQKVGACLATMAAACIPCSMFCLREAGRLIQSSISL